MPQSVIQFVMNSDAFTRFAVFTSLMRILAYFAGSFIHFFLLYSF